MDGGLHPCRKCLLYSETREEFFRKLDSYIKNLSEDEKVSQDVYDTRLEICGQCPLLTDGMCTLCGCYVELRAAKKIRRCPDTPSRW